MAKTVNRKSDTAEKTGPDVGDLKGRDLPRADFPGRGSEPFRIFIDEKVHQQIIKHGKDNPDAEVCGVLVGLWKRDDDGPFVAITAAIAGEAADNKLAEVTFTHETWAKINKRMDEEFADDRIVGWYHTHPDFGVFLSDRDRFIHEHFFSEPGQVAYVVDPIRKEEGFFTWAAGKPAMCSHYWVGQRLQVGAGDDGGKIHTTDHSLADDDKTDSDEPQSEGGAERRPDMSWIMQLAWGLCLFLLGYLVATHFAASAELKYVDAVSRFAAMKGLRAGLGVNLDIVNAALDDTAAKAKALADPNVTTQPSDLARGSAQVAAQLAECRKAIRQLQSVYALTPAEEELVSTLGLQQFLDSGTLKPATQPGAGSSPTTTTQPSK